MLGNQGRGSKWDHQGTKSARRLRLCPRRDSRVLRRQNPREHHCTVKLSWWPLCHGRIRQLSSSNLLGYTHSSSTTGASISERALAYLSSSGSLPHSAPSAKAFPFDLQQDYASPVLLYADRGLTTSPASFHHSAKLGPRPEHLSKNQRYTAPAARHHHPCFPYSYRRLAAGGGSGRVRVSCLSDAAVGAPLNRDQGEGSPEFPSPFQVGLQVDGYCRARGQVLSCPR